MYFLKYFYVLSQSFFSTKDNNSKINSKPGVFQHKIGYLEKGIITRSRNLKFF